MNVSSVGATGTPLYAQQAGSRTPSSFSNTAQLLGLSTDQLGSDLQSGTTLASLAQQRGVSGSALMSSVEQDLKATNPLAAHLPQSALTQVAGNVINGTMPTQGGGSHHHHHGGGGGLLDAIDPTPSDSTATLSGVTAPAAASIAELGLTNQSSSITTATDPASILAAATDATSSPTAANNLSTLSLATGLSPSDLLTQLSSGQDISGLLGSTGVTGYGSTLAQSVSGGVVFDGYA